MYDEGDALSGELAIENFLITGNRTPIEVSEMPSEIDCGLHIQASYPMAEAVQKAKGLPVRVAKVRVEDDGVEVLSSETRFGLENYGVQYDPEEKTGSLNLYFQLD